MAMTGGGWGKVRSDINVTPLVDVVLVLLIIFMVVTPLLQRGRAVELPDSMAVDRVGKGGDPLIVSVTADGAIWVDQTRTDEEGLARALREEVAANPYRPILLKGDDRVVVGTIRKVMAIARKAGVRGMELAVTQTPPAQG